ncbi:MAG TPA: GTPase, partial [Allosphingosinicella sp.]
SPKLGMVRHKGVDFVLADIPGLIEGAAEGAGIGDRFLGHVERTRVLIHLVDANVEDVAAAYRTVRDELEAYGADLEEKKEVLILNKMDTIDAELSQALSAELAEEAGRRVLAVSGATGAGVEAVLDAVIRHLGAIEEEEAEPNTDWSPLR